MSDASDKRPLNQRIIIAAGLVLILVVLPAISWMYLSSGLNWHKKAVAELGQYGQIPSAYIVWPTGEQQDRLDGKVTVVHIFGESPDLTESNKKIIDTGEELFKQYGKNEYFRLGMIAEGGTSEFRSYLQTRPSADYATWVWTGGLGSWRTVVENGYESYCVKTGAKSVPLYYGLSDTSGTLRRFYNALDDEEVKRMVQQIAILLPK